MPFTDSNGRPELVAGDWFKTGIAKPRVSAPTPPAESTAKRRKGDRRRPPQSAGQDKTAEQ